MENQESRTAILKKLAAVRGDVAYIQKGGRNAAQGYSFLSERQITELFKELFDKHGVMFTYSSVITGSMETPKKTQIITNVRVNYAFIDVETGEVLGGSAAGQGADSGDKGVYKAITGAIKYVFMKTFLIPTGDDPEEDTREEKTVAKGKAAKRDRDYGSSYGDGEPATKRNDTPFPEED